MRRFNLSLDDFSPHQNAGLNFESIMWCNKLIERFPDIKINLFVPSAFCRLGEKPCYLSENPEWIQKVKDLPNNYRINLHGLFHRRTDGKHPDSNNDEFQYLAGNWADSYIETMMTEFNNVGIKYHKTFRPPGWKINAKCVKNLTRRGFLIAGNDTYFKLLHNDVPNMRWVSYNYDLIGKVPSGDIIAYGHTSNWTNNYLNQDKYELLCKILGSNKFSFSFIEEFEEHTK